MRIKKTTDNLDKMKSLNSLVKEKIGTLVPAVDKANANFGLWTRRKKILEEQIKSIDSNPVSAEAKSPQKKRLSTSPKKSNSIGKDSCATAPGTPLPTDFVPASTLARGKFQFRTVKKPQQSSEK